MTDTTKKREIKLSLDQLADFTKKSRQAIAKAGGVPPEKVNIEKLEMAVEKAKADICAALGVPTNAITLSVSAAVSQ